MEVTIRHRGTTRHEAICNLKAQLRDSRYTVNELRIQLLLARKERDAAERELLWMQKGIRNVIIAIAAVGVAALLLSTLAQPSTKNEEPRTSQTLP
jgi:hypothetical protein